MKKKLVAVLVASCILAGCESQNLGPLEDKTTKLRDENHKLKSDIQDLKIEIKKEKTNISKEFDQEGIDFSGGERQKIAIARALHKKSCITILDEPTASLSSNSENQLYKMVLNCKDNIIFFISHRLSSCRFTDKIIVFDSGMIKEIGSHDELMNLNGIYTQLFLAQAELYRLGGEENEE